MDETIYVIFKVQFDFALEVWFSKLGNLRIMSAKRTKDIKEKFLLPVKHGDTQKSGSLDISVGNSS